jgi:hypothetical protein
VAPSFQTPDQPRAMGEDHRIRQLLDDRATSSAWFVDTPPLSWGGSAPYLYITTPAEDTGRENPSR